jgi:arylsulfatase A-like enzyme
MANAEILVRDSLTTIPSVSRGRIPWSEILRMAVCVGIMTGLVEGCGLLVFQNINGETWALRISPPIIWISPVVDVLFFCFLAGLVGLAATLFRKMDAAQVTAALLSGLVVYDLLTLTARFSSRSRVLLTIGVAVAVGRWFPKHQAALERICKRSFPWVVAVGVLVFGGIQGGRWFGEHRTTANLPAAVPDAPNVLVIVVDTLRADHLSSYGYGHPTSPNLDALAREGALFENAVSACSWTYPSHVSMVTGRAQFEHGRDTLPVPPLFHPGKNIFNGYPTIGDVLQKHGYRTGAFSANRSFFVGDLGFNRGFIHFEDYFNSIPDMFARTLVGKEFLRLYGKIAKGELSNRIVIYGMHSGFRKQPGDVNQELLSWIDKTGPRPFFAFLNYYSVHEPYGLPDSPQVEPKGTPADTERYDQGVEYTDRYIGLLMQSLKQRRLDKNTLVIVTGDHGESLTEHNFQGHGRFLYWEQIHVPLIFWYPGHLPAGKRIDQPVSNVSIAASIMNLTGMDSGEFPGPALNLAWQGHEVKWPDPISELAKDTRIFKDDPALNKRLATAQTGSMKSLVTPQWHLIVHNMLGEQLFDWRHDPTESKNLIGSAEGQKIAGQLLSELASELSESVSNANQSASVPKLQNESMPEPAKTAAIAQNNNGRYDVRAESGGKLNIQIRAANPKGLFDPVVTIEDADGQMMQSCRNGSDDKIPLPGIADSTPQSFDDMCVSGGFRSTETKSELEILVPGQPGTSTELRLRIDNWNGHRVNNSDYLVTVNPAAE